MTYRPTVRYDESFRDYVNSIFHATHLDRNQIIRGALFAAAHSKEFHDLLTIYKKPGVSLPSPKWDIRQHGYWMEQRYQPEEEGRDVTHVNFSGNRTTTEPTRKAEPIHRHQQPVKRFEGTIHGRESIRIANARGISFSL